MTGRTERKDACAGDDIGLKLSEYAKGYRMKINGKVLSEPGIDQCKPAASFIAQIIVMNTPTQIKRGYRP